MVKISPTQAFILVAVVAMIGLCTVFTQSAFTQLSQEANNGTWDKVNDTTTYNHGSQTYNWIYVIGLLLIIAAILIAFKLLQQSATS
jgi:protein-S-isoprenylcysteine O-methyltransferase Ste14